MLTFAFTFLVSGAKPRSIQGLLLALLSGIKRAGLQASYVVLGLKHGTVSADYYSSTIFTFSCLES